MKIAIAGSSGLIGTQLVASLRSDGHEVLRLVRRPATAPTEISWDPVKGTVDLDKLTGIDVLVNLAGAGVGDHRWSVKYKHTILSSRVDSTSLCADIATKVQPHVFISASAIGWYGDTADRKVNESTPAGEGFLADVVVAWEAAAQPARDAGIRGPVWSSPIKAALGASYFLSSNWVSAVRWVQASNTGHSSRWRMKLLP